MRCEEDFDMDPKMKRKSGGERKMEMYEIEIFFSAADKERVQKDLPGYMKDLLEKQGHTVNRVLVTSEFERRAKEEVMRAGAGPAEEDMLATVGHIVWPEHERSIWI
jgi:hypothetical protein